MEAASVNQLRVTAFSAVLNLLAARPAWELVVIALVFAMVVKILADFITNAAMNVRAIKKIADAVGFNAKATELAQINTKLDELLKGRRDD